MNDIEKAKIYFEQTDARVKVDKVFNEYEDNLSELNSLLEILIKYTIELPEQSEFFRARIIEPEFYDDLQVVEDGILQSLFGFVPDKMKAPPRGVTTAGRLNKKGESFLYLSNKPEVCCAEVRPILSEMISVARFELKHCVTVVNLKAVNIESTTPLEVVVLERVMWELVQPVKEKTDENYKLTQYISHYFKSKGFDGVKYGTLNSNDSESFNLLLFDDDNVTCNDGRSSVYRVISKSQQFQNLTNQDIVVGAESGYGPLNDVDVNKIILKIRRYLNRIK